MNVPDRLLLGPGPSPVSDRVMRAMQRPVLSHLDPEMMAILDDIRARLNRVFRADADAFSFAVSGTGTAGMETGIANLTRPGTRAIASTPHARSTAHPAPRRRAPAALRPPV